MDADQVTAEHARDVANDGQAGQHKEQRNDFGRHKKSHRLIAMVSSASICSIDLHGTDLRGDRGADTPGDDQRGQDRAQFPANRNRDQTGHIMVAPNFVN